MCGDITLLNHKGMENLTGFGVVSDIWGDTYRAFNFLLMSKMLVELEPIFLCNYTWQTVSGCLYEIVGGNLDNYGTRSDGNFF